VAALLVWLAAVEAGTQAWYGLHERGLEQRVRWDLEWPVGAPGFRLEPIEEPVRRILRYSTGQSAVWRREDGAQWLLYWFRWRAGRTAPQLARAHSPEVCLPAGGLRLVAYHGLRTLGIQGLDLPFRVYSFELRQEPLVVFYGLWEERVARDAPGSVTDPFSRASRLESVLAGRRHLGQMVFEAALAGAKDPAGAAEQLRAFLQGALRVRSDRR
jgi:hypothetical protein